MGLGLGMGMGCSLRRPATWHAVVAVFLQVGFHTSMFFLSGTIVPFDGSAFVVQVTPCEFDQNEFHANVGMRFVSYTFSVLLLGTNHSAYDQDPELRVWISGAPPQRDHHGSEGLPQFPLSAADRGAQ